MSWELVVDGWFLMVHVMVKYAGWKIKYYLTQEKYHAYRENVFQYKTRAFCLWNKSYDSISMSWNQTWYWCTIYFALFPNKLYSVHIYIISPGVKDILLDNGIRWCVYNTFFLHNNYRNSNVIDIPYIDNIFISLA